MFWIALWPTAEHERAAWGWRALQFTPRVAQVDEALLLETAGSERLFGGRRALLNQIFEPNEPLARAEHATGATSLVALARLRLVRAGLPLPPAPTLPGALPLHTLSAAQAQLAVLGRLGVNTWGALRALPRAGVARRFGQPLLDALDAGWGQRPERYPWLTLPEVFDQRLELPALATTAPELLWSAQRLLAQLQVWLVARQRGVLALELEWTLDLRRLDGRALPPHERLAIRTAQPAQDLAHLRRLVGEQLARAKLSAPANHLRLRTLETVPWQGASHSFLAGDNPPGEALHQLVERLSARLGAHNVQVPLAQADHRPEHMQRWIAAQEAQDVPTRPAVPPAHPVDALYPPWLLPQPLALVMRDNVPQYEGPLRLMTRMQRVEGCWWEPTGPVVRDYCVARSERAGLVWVFRERHRWYLQGLYA